MTTVRSWQVLVLDVTDDLGDQVERVTSSLRPRPDVLRCEDLQGAQEMIGARGPIDVLVAGTLASNGSGLRELRRLADRTPATKIVLAFDHLRASSMRDIVRTGAVDVLRLPVDDEVLLEAIEHALNSRSVAVPTVSEPSAPVSPGTVTTVVSATGGCGKTFFTANLGCHLARQGPGRTCLIDLDLQFGELSTALRLKPRYTVSDLLTHNDETEGLGVRLEECLLRHDTGVYVLAAPEEPAQADVIEAEDIARVIEAARARFENVIVDTSAALSEATLVALDHADQIFALATLDLPSVRSLGLLLTTF
ncbi:MAG TPA: AAA family ATPase, partial [Acidimicrobiales bacterium]